VYNVVAQDAKREILLHDWVLDPRTLMVVCVSMVIPASIAALLCFFLPPRARAGSKAYIAGSIGSLGRARR